jgi:23S rRNA pseudouridine2457 synthase
MVSDHQKSTRSFLFFKPYGVLCQFTDAAGRPTLADFGPFPRDVYAAGRLDADSEGLVLLTNDNALKTRLIDPRFAHPRTYYVQVERVPDATGLGKLREGVMIEGTKTRPAVVHLLSAEPDLPPRAVPIRYRKNVPTAWLEITLREGRNRQIRRMTAAIGNPTLRLVRVRIGKLSVEGLAPGVSRQLRPDELSLLLKH